MSHVKKLINKKIIKPPEYVGNGLVYEAIVGSMSYGVSTDKSDLDIMGICIPDKDIIFPHLKGEIEGFGRQKNRFEQFQKHHNKIENIDYDITVYNIVKYFNLTMNCNPNMIDSLYVPRRCITHTTQIGEHIRENRKLFLSKLAWHKFKGYAYSQLHKMKIKNPDENSKRKWMYDEYGYDCKFAYNVIRLLHEIEMILIEEDLDLERNREQLKSIRRGEWTMEQIIEYAGNKEKKLENIYLTSKLVEKPREKEIKNLLFECLEIHYGSLDNVVHREDKYEIMIKEIKEIIERNK